MILNISKKLEKEETYSSFKEFISKGKIPDNWSSLRQVEISSLQDLIDAAVDMSERVIRDIESCAYFIIHDNVLYIFFTTHLQWKMPGEK
ncbi:DUF5305 family protein [Methanosarcina horonobensis]|uniref:DUF5305 family protein n=1 Tax=Methanosarcina horonobensis TaxID=418008 RepID=UPI00373FD191